MTRLLYRHSVISDCRILIYKYYRIITDNIGEMHDFQNQSSLLFTEILIFVYKSQLCGIIKVMMLEQWASTVLI